MSEPVRWDLETLKRHMEQFPGGAEEYARKFNSITPEQIREHLDKKKAATPPPKKKSERTQPTRGLPNKTEAAYAVFLDQLKVAANVASYKFESITLKLAEGCRYTPDYLVIPKTGPIQLHEVKRRWRNAKQRGPNFEGDARAKLLTAAKLFPEFDFILAWYDGMSWHIEHIAK